MKHAFTTAFDLITTCKWIHFFALGEGFLLEENPTSLYMFLRGFFFFYELAKKLKQDIK